MLNLTVKPEIRESISLQDNFEIIEKSYEGFVALMDMYKSDKKGCCGNLIFGNEFNSVKGKTLKSNKLDFLLSPFLDGIYIPATKRNYIWGEVDLKNDILPESGSVIHTIFDRNDYSFGFVSVNKKNIDKKNYLFSGNEDDIFCSYKISNITICNDFSKRKLNSNSVIINSYLVIDNKGRIKPAFSRKELRNGNGVTSKSNYMREEIDQNLHMGCGAIGLLSDRQYLWQIETKENIFDDVNGKIVFGSDPELVKSLFFAREQPLTESGRKRPILHWVKQHKRRISENINIDISKHLRGITEFEMGGLNFKITKPIKNQEE